MRERGISFRRTITRAALLVGVFLLVAIFLPDSATRTLRSIVETVFFPVEWVFSHGAAGISDVTRLFGSIGTIKSDNDRLRMENIRLRSETAELDYLRNENNDLRASIGLDIRKRFDLIATEVIAAGGESDQGSILISRGLSSGIQTGMPVVIGEGTLVGIVSETYPASARVSLLTNAQSAQGGMTAERGVKGIVRGDRSVGILLSMVLMKDDLREGDRVVTSGIGGRVPPGLFIGTIEHVTVSNDRLFQQAGVLSPVNFSDLRFVNVILSSNDR